MQSMSSATDVITIEEASRATDVSLGTLGYWIIAGMLEATVTAEGRVVRLADVRRVADALNPAARPAREFLIQEDRVIDPTPRPTTPARDDLFSEVQARLERLDQQLQRVDQTLLGQIGHVDRIDAARDRDAEALQRVQLTLEQHAEALRRLEAQQATAQLPLAAQARVGQLRPPQSPEPGMVLRFRPLNAAAEPAPTPAAPTLRMRETTPVRPSTPAPAAAAARPFGLRLSLPRLPFAMRKPVGDKP
jgi:hypothetical protein